MNKLTSLVSNPLVIKTTAVAAMALGAVYYLANSFKKNSTPPITIQKTLCTSFADKISKQVQADKPKVGNRWYNQTKEVMDNFYEKKQNMILDKHNLTKQDFGDALDLYQEDPQLLKDKQEIIEMMQRGVVGQWPDLTVPEEADQLYDQKQVEAIYLEMLTLVAVSVWQRLYQSLTSDPAFDSQNDECFKAVMKTINIYDIKTNFLSDKGYKMEWGAVSEIFFKVIQNEKKKNSQFKSRIGAIQKFNQKMVQMISHEIEQFTEQKIKNMFKQGSQQNYIFDQSLFVRTQPVQVDSIQPENKQYKSGKQLLSEFLGKTKTERL